MSAGAVRAGCGQGEGTGMAVNSEVGVVGFGLAFIDE
jgi:hypothetical protein